MFPAGDGDEYLSLCLKAKADHAREIRRIFQENPNPSFEVIDAVGSGGGWPTLQALLRVESARDILFALLAPSEKQKDALRSQDAWVPEQFDLAIMDRFALYLPGWEMPKTSSEYLTNAYGFITDYLAEAFHYQFKHVNRYEEVNKRVRLGKAVEGRDEKGIKKTVCALLKILHPGGEPSDAELAEYVAYAAEGRRRVKEQMNKRKPDEEFANINLSFFGPDGKGSACRRPLHPPASPGAEFRQVPRDGLPARQPSESGARHRQRQPRAADGELAQVR